MAHGVGFHAGDRVRAMRDYGTRGPVTGTLVGDFPGLDRPKGKSWVRTEEGSLVQVSTSTLEPEKYFQGGEMVFKKGDRVTGRRANKSGTLTPGNVTGVYDCENGLDKTKAWIVADDGYTVLVERDSLLFTFKGPISDGSVITAERGYTAASAAGYIPKEHTSGTPTDVTEPLGFDPSASDTRGFEDGDEVRVNLLDGTSWTGKFDLAKSVIKLAKDMNPGVAPVSDITFGESFLGVTVDGKSPTKTTPFVTKDSGQREEFGNGSVRDTEEGKPRYDLISPIASKRRAELMARGAEKYGDRNWEKGQPASRFLSSLMRHVEMYRLGDRTEDHLAAIGYNSDALMHFENTEWDDVNGIKD